MEREELESLDRDALILRARKFGVERAHVLTRPEIVDELLLRSEEKPLEEIARERGFFGRARDLLARVVEKGLHLPDAAEKIRTAFFPLPMPKRPSHLPTVTLAGIYAAQGHRDRAIETLKGVLAEEPEHEAARELLVQLETKQIQVPEPPLPPESEDADVPGRSHEAFGPTSSELAESDPAPAFCGTEVHPGRSPLFRWRIPRASAEWAMAKRIEPGGDELTLRVLVIEPTWDGPKSMVLDHAASIPEGELRIHGPMPKTAVLRAAIGVASGDRFFVVAQSAPVEILPN